MADGGWNDLSRHCSVGSYGARNGARIACFHPHARLFRIFQAEEPYFVNHQPDSKILTLETEKKNLFSPPFDHPKTGQTAFPTPRNHQSGTDSPRKRPATAAPLAGDGHASCASSPAPNRATAGTRFHTASISRPDAIFQKSALSDNPTERHLFDSKTPISATS